MATIIDFGRALRRGSHKRLGSDERAVVQFWRDSMVWSSIAMGVIVVLAAGTLFFGLKHGLMDHDWGMWVLVVALFAMAGLTKVIIANIFFYILLQEDMQLGKTGVPPRDPGLRTQATAPVKRTAGARRWRRIVRRGNVSASAGQRLEIHR
jgi:hypothetical protein